MADRNKPTPFEVIQLADSLIEQGVYITPEMAERISDAWETQWGNNSNPEYRQIIDQEVKKAVSESGLKDIFTNKLMKLMTFAQAHFEDYPMGFILAWGDAVAAAICFGNVGKDSFTKLFNPFSATLAEMAAEKAEQGETEHEPAGPTSSES